MAIQFLCVACRQPIEVDDEMANQTVTCPYCRKVVTAPAATEAVIQENPPIARSPGADEGASSLPYAPVTPQSANKWSWVSLGCVSFCLITAAIYAGTLYNIVVGFPPDVTPAESQKLLMKEMQARTGLQVLVIAGFCMAPLVGIITGIVALVKRQPPRWPAITSLAICGLIVVLLCLSAVVTFAAAGGKPAG